MVSYSDIQSRDDFFKLLNISKQHMTYLLYNKDKKGTENSYYTFEIEKKNGGVRVIHSPNDELSKKKSGIKKVYTLIFHMLMKKIKVLSQMLKFTEIKNLY